MTGIGLATKGYISRFIKRFVLPYNVQLKTASTFNLYIKNQASFSVSAADIVDKNVNLKIIENDINVKNTTEHNLNITG